MTTTTASITHMCEQPFLNHDGTVSEYADDVFTNHHCWYLAWVLHTKTGWPIVAVTDADAVGEGNYGWVHVLVQTPTGDLLDVQGHQSPQDIVDHWADYCDYPDDIDLNSIPAADFVRLINDDPGAASDAFATATSDLADALLAQTTS